MSNESIKSSWLHTANRFLLLVNIGTFVICAALITVELMKHGKSRVAVQDASIQGCFIEVE